MTPNILHHVFVLFLIVAFPIWDRHEAKLLKTSTDPNAKRNSYLKTIGWQIVATAFLFATVPIRILYVAPVSADTFMPRFSGMLLPILVALGVGMLLPILIPLIKKDVRNPPKQLESIAFFLPRTKAEKLWFAVMCITVGICEEVIFRGFLIQYLHALPFGFEWPAAVIGAAVIFGIDHGYQGWKGILATGFLALVFTVLFFASGSLLVPMLLHAVMDLRILALVGKSQRRMDNSSR
ncbi:MAG TPA: CPBP family intramembrane glutamic endopeptidase [Longimicrobiales bacterium]|nr:CPBP family intramembrane glutamic endopeptidase [Longimicrobiales bacterium]